MSALVEKRVYVNLTKPYLDAVERLIRQGIARANMGYPLLDIRNTLCCVFHIPGCSSIKFEGNGKKDKQ